ncbi:hypothetical protein MMC20_005250 [Loxospora ochrophaea]|nr:hypothetical protein [Loxospora ochrophaea]
MLCLGTSIGVLVAGRLLQGLAASIVWVVGLALLVDTVGQKEIGLVMGYVSMSISIAILLGPLLGGVVYARAGYYPVYYMAFGLIALDIILRFALIEKKIAKQWLPSESQSQSVVPSATPSVIEARRSVEHSIVLEATHPTPVISDLHDLPAPRPHSKLPAVLTLLSSRRLVTALWGTLVSATFLTAFDSTLPLLVQAIFGWDSTGAGLIFLALIIPTFAAPFIGFLSDKYGPRWIIAPSFLLLCPVLVLLRFVDHDGIRQEVLLCALLAMLGLGNCAIDLCLLSEIANVVEAKERKMPGKWGERGAYAQAYGLFNTAFAGGTLLGPIWGGYIKQRAGWGTMAWTLGLLSAVSVVPAVGALLQGFSPSLQYVHALN